MNKISHDPRNVHAGFGLVEIMLALAVSMFLIAGVIQIFLANNQSYRLAEGMSRLQENARFSIKSLSQALEPGGYQGCVGAAAENFVNTLNDTGSAYDYGVSVVGTEGGAGPDTVTLRRAVGMTSIAVTAPMTSQTAPIQLDATDSDYADLEQYQILTISDCAHSAVFMITNDPTASGGTIQHQAGPGFAAPAGGLNAGQYNATTDLQHVFGAKTNAVATVYSSSSVTYALGPGTSGTLSLLADGQELVEGVRDMQVTYGLPVGGNIQFVSASSPVLTPAAWANVESIRVALTLDTVEQVTTTTSTGMIEKEFGRTFRVRNRNP